MIARLLHAALATLAAALGPFGVPPRAATAAEAASELRLTSSVAVSARMRELTFTTPAIDGPVRVRVLLPRDAAAHPDARYPALYLLHGSGGDAEVWTNLDVEPLTEELGVVVVMPDGGKDGWYTDWPGGRPQWERFHVDELIPWIDAHEPTIAARGKRAIAGLSMGGFGAMSYAARHPDRFAAASSFSGALDLGTPPGSASSFVGVQPWGSWTGASDLAWRGHNPVDLAGNLRGVALSVYTGEGDGGDDIEPTIFRQSEAFARRTGALGIARQYVDYGRGGHDPELFKRDLQQALPGLMEAFAAPPALPSPWSFTATEQTFAVRGYTLRAARNALAWRSLSRVRAGGLVVRSDGPAVVTTARRYVRRGRYRVVVSPLRAGAFRKRSAVLRADGDGRLRIAVPASAAVGITRERAQS